VVSWSAVHKRTIGCISRFLLVASCFFCFKNKIKTFKPAGFASNRNVLYIHIIGIPQQNRTEQGSHPPQLALGATGGRRTLCAVFPPNAEDYGPSHQHHHYHHHVAAIQWLVSVSTEQLSHISFGANPAMPSVLLSCHALLFVGI